jgi:hypothetical protein
MNDSDLWSRRLQSLDARRLIRTLLLGIAVAVGSYSTAIWIAGQIHFRDYLGDYSVFWGVAALPIERLYGDIHFPYPPSALLLIRPFGYLQFWWAYAVWTGLGVALMVLAARRIVGWDSILIGFLSAAALGVVVGGQTSLFIGALIVGAVSSPNSIVTGILLGIAAAIKPQAVLAAPFALLADRNYRAILWAAVAGVTQILASVLIWGPQLWVRWITDLHTFPTYLQVRDLDKGDKGAYGLLLQLGLPSWLYVLAIPLGILCTWTVFRGKAEPLERYVAFAVATILISPYTLGYDLAALSIACAGLLLNDRRGLAVWIAAAFIMSSVLANWGVILMALLMIRHWWTAPRSATGA